MDTDRVERLAKGTLVSLGGIEYEASPCTHCENGRHYDATLAHMPNHGWVQCNWCIDGMIYKITRRGIQQEVERRS